MAETRWALSHLLGLIGVATVVGTLVLLTVSGRLEIGRRVRALIPQPVEDFFRRPAAPAPADDQRNERALSEGVRKLTEVPTQPSAAAGTFGLGATKERVRQVQGAPGQATDTVWTYGASQVFFVAGRVVGWRQSKANPLRVR